MQEQLKQNQHRIICQLSKHSQNQQNGLMLNQYQPLTKNKLKCVNNNLAYIACCKKTCSQPAFRCKEDFCQCNQKHLDCHHLIVKNIINNINSFQKQIPKDAKQTFSLLYQKINTMIDQLSLLRQKFHYQEIFYGLKQIQIQFIKLIQQNQINKINGKIINSLQQSFKQRGKTIFFKKQEFLQQFKRQQQVFINILKDIKDKYSKKILSSNQLFINDSKIINHLKQKELILQWLYPLKKSQQGKIQSKLIFRGSEHNFNIKQFHNYCDGIPNTLVIVKTQFDKIIGGFTPCKWQLNPPNSYIEDKQGTSFMYSLSLKQKYECINPKTAISDYGYGPRFGNNGADLSIGNNDSINSYASFPLCYNLNNKYKKIQNGERNSVLTGGTISFKVKEYEVYQILNI